MTRAEIEAEQDNVEVSKPCLVQMVAAAWI